MLQKVYLKLDRNKSRAYVRGSHKSRDIFTVRYRYYYSLKQEPPPAIASVLITSVSMTSPAH